MCAALTLPEDLSPDEAAEVAAFVDRARRVAEEEARERAAKAVRVRREVRRLRARGLSVRAACAQIADDGVVPVSAEVARRIWHRLGGWALDGR